MIGQTNAASGSLDPNSALIHVSAPLGSTVEFAKGGVTVKTIPPAKGHANVDGQTADYYYSVSSANYGTWTITASLSGETASDTVSVSAAEQYDVLLEYKLWLFKDGDQCTAVTGGWTRTGQGSSVIQDGYIQVYRAGSPASLSHGTKITRGNYTKLTFEYINSASATGSACVAITTDTSLNESDVRSRAIAYVNQDDAIHTTPTVRSLDITAATSVEEFYVVLLSKQSQDRFYKIYLE